MQLLQRQRDRKESVALGLAQFNVNKLVSQLNKSKSTNAKSLAWRPGDLTDRPSLSPSSRVQTTEFYKN